MSKTKPIRVMVVDDHEMVRDGLGLMIDTHDDLERAGEAGNAETALIVCEEQQPDVILMDIMMPGKDGIAATKEIQEKHPNVQIIILTNYDEAGMVETAFKAGATSYLRKSISIDELAKAIRKAFNGKPTLSTEATEELIATTVQPAIGHDLTVREWDVVKLLAEGLINREIAEKLVISPSTVKHHVSSILKKLSAKNRSEVVAIALNHNLLD